MVIVPKAKAVGFLQGSTVNHLRTLLTGLTENLRRGGDGQCTRELIVQICQRKLATGRSVPEVLGEVAKAAMSIADRSLFNGAVRAGETAFDDWSFSNLGRLIRFQTPLAWEDG